MRGSRNKPMQLPPDPLDELPPDDWDFPAAILYRWLVLGRKADELLRARGPRETSPEWKFGWDACLDALKRGLPPTLPEEVPTRDEALRILDAISADLAREKSLTTQTLAYNLRLVAQLLADEIDRGGQDAGS